VIRGCFFLAHRLPLGVNKCTGQATAEAMVSVVYVGMAGAIVRQRKSLSASGQRLNERRTSDWQQPPAANNADSCQRRRLCGFRPKNTKARRLAGLPQLSFWFHYSTF
jgi:hypothetical protein